MSSDYGFPEGFARQAFEALGPYRRSIQAFVRRLNRIEWFSRVGQPEPWDETVLRVWTLDEARVVERDRRPLSDAVWACTERLGSITGRLAYMSTAEEYRAARFNFDFPDWLPDDITQVQIGTDCAGAEREIILDDLVSLRYFREYIDWYERGHWLCGIADDGRRIVY